MSWEYDKYEAVCEQCGRQGFCIEGSDDWGRSSTSWLGFEDQEPHPYAYPRGFVNCLWFGWFPVFDLLPIALALPVPFLFARRRLPIALLRLPS